MPPTVEPIVAPTGLVTQPNKLGQYAAGALSQAQGAAIRSPGLLTRMPEFLTYQGSPFINTPSNNVVLLGAADTMLFQVSQNIATGHWELSFFNGASVFGNDLTFAPVTLPYPIRAVFDLNYTSFPPTTTSQRGRPLFNATNGIYICDTSAPTSNAQAMPRAAGIAAPVMQTGVTVSTTGGFTVTGALKNGYGAAITAVIRREYADGYEVISAPAPPVYVGNADSSGSAGNILMEVFYAAYSGVQAGDFVDFYRTPQQAFGTNVGSTFYLDSTQQVTSADITARATGHFSTTADTGLGEELYTNPGQQGSDGAKLVPPLAACMATYKGYTFYGNVTQPATLPLGVPHGFGDNQSSSVNPAYLRLNSLGGRQVGGTVTFGSPTMTGISAADMIGLSVGQIVTGFSGFFGTVTALGATTLTINNNCTTAGSTLIGADVADVIVVNGSTTALNNWAGITYGLGGNGGQNLTAFAAGVIVNEYQSGTGTPAFYDQSPRQIAITAMRAGGGSFTIKATNGQNYTPPLPLLTQTALTVSPQQLSNGLVWSELGQPEAVPPFNELEVGVGTIQAMTATRDGLYIFASDGLWRLTGTGGTAGVGYDWSLQLLDSTLSIAAPHAYCVLRDTVYAYTNRGLVSIGPGTYNNQSGFNSLSASTVNDILPGPPFSYTPNIQMTADETNDEIWLGVKTGGSMVFYVYNTLTSAWTVSGTGGGLAADQVLVYSRALQAVASMSQLQAYAQETVPTTFQTTVVDFQPIYTEDPFSLKQWIDATYIGSLADAGKNIFFRFNGTAVSPNRALVSQLTDSRVSLSVPRNTPAISNSLAPGFASSGTAQLSFYGFTLRSNVLTNQRKQR